ncbi:MAG: phosphate uptake regulator PhoU, partial [Verrucomicrobiota bacterium]
LALLRDGIRSYAEGDTDLVISLYDRDKELDAAHSEVIREITKQFDSGTGRVKSFLHLVFIVRSLERVGDHAVNIAEDGIFLESAADIRHLGPELAAEEIDAQS